MKTLVISNSPGGVSLGGSPRRRGYIAKVESTCKIIGGKLREIDCIAKIYLRRGEQEILQVELAGPNTPQVEDLIIDWMYKRRNQKRSSNDCSCDGGKQGVCCRR